jgi:hypothetical protein
VVWETLALGNLMVALATCRDCDYQTIGALGALELTLPHRVTAASSRCREAQLTAFDLS